MDNRKRNRSRWDELVPVHMKSSFYDMENFKRGKDSLQLIELEELGEVAGKDLLHLQCHFGMDSLSLARQGAKVTGVDFSPVAIEAAQLLSDELSIPARFICSDVYRLRGLLSGSFDVVFCSYGVICWLDDLGGWAEIISSYLRTGGFFYIVDEHPFARAFTGSGHRGKLKLGYPYFDSPTPVRFRVKGSYANRCVKVRNSEVYLWYHSISSIMNSLIRVGLNIEFLHEFPYSFYKMFSGMVMDEQKRWRLKGRSNSLPCLFSIKANK